MLTEFFHHTDSFLKVDNENVQIVLFFHEALMWKPWLHYSKRIEQASLRFGQLLICFILPLAQNIRIVCKELPTNCLLRTQEEGSCFANVACQIKFCPFSFLLNFKFLSDRSLNECKYDRYIATGKTQNLMFN